MRQDAHEAMDDEAEREEQDMLEAAQLASAVGEAFSSGAIATDTAPSTSATSTPDSPLTSTDLKVTKAPVPSVSTDLEEVTIGIISGDPFRQRHGSFSQESPSFHAARRAVEMKAGIIPRTFNDFMQRNFNVLRVGCAQPLAITRAMLIIIEGVVGDLSAIDVSQSTFVRFLWKAGSNYHDCPYHNWHHAFCVVQYMAVLLR
jgi:hypothetical protein